MKNYALLVQLIGFVEQLENEHGQEKELSLLEYTNYLVGKTAIQKQHELHEKKIDLLPDKRHSDVINLEAKREIENNISRLLLMLTRHARNYAKKAFDQTPLQTLEDFSYLAMLFNVPSIVKTDLINNNFQEKTSGSEVIRRLLASNLASQFDDNLDKRSKRVMITEDGKKLIKSIFRNMGIISEMLVHNLSVKERNVLLAILQKMDSFQRDEFSNTRTMNIDQLELFIS